jgi:hypothetical protein
MNRKRKILTVVALAVFAAIIGLHYVHLGFGETPYLEFSPTYKATIKDVRMPLFVLAVFYVGLFSLLGDKKRDSQ